MANAKIGSQASWNGDLVESITADKQLTPGDSGKVFMCDQNATGTVLSNLPKLGSDIAGWHASFILRVASSELFVVMAYGLPAAGGSSASVDSDKVIHAEFVTDGNASTESTTSDGLQFSASATVGARIDAFTDGTNWYMSAFATADADIGAPDA